MEIVRVQGVFGNTKPAKVYDASGKHIKTIPGYYARVLKDTQIKYLITNGIDLEKKSLTAADKKLISKNHLEDFISSFLERLKKNEKYVFELIENKEYKGAREVYGYRGKKRYELCFINNTNLKIDKPLFDIFIEKLPSVKLNY